VLPSDEHRLVLPLWRFAYVQEAVGRYRFGLALQRERLHRLDLGRVADERERRLADQHLARLRRPLQPRRHVHSVAGRQPFFGTRHHLAGRDADPSLDFEPGQGLLHLDRGPAGPQSVVLMRYGDAEDGHHCVADELFNRAPVTLDHGLHLVEEASKARPHYFRIGRLALPCGVDDVAEEDRDRLPDLARWGLLNLRL